MNKLKEEISADHALACWLTVCKVLLTQRSVQKYGSLLRFCSWTAQQLTTSHCKRCWLNPTYICFIPTKKNKVQAMYSLKDWFSSFVTSVVEVTPVVTLVQYCLLPKKKELNLHTSEIHSCHLWTPQRAVQIEFAMLLNHLTFLCIALSFLVPLLRKKNALHVAKMC